MIYEYALEPALMACWHDRRKYLFFEEKFGVRSCRFISCFPRKKWKRLVWKEFMDGPHSKDENAKTRMTEIIQSIWQKAITRPSTFSEIRLWLERAEAEHTKRPFHAIIAKDNPRNRPFVIQAEALVENGHELWKIPEHPPTPRMAEEMANTLSPVLKVCHNAILVEPYFDPNKRRFRQPLKAILKTCCFNVCGLDPFKFELHTSIDRFFKRWEKGKDRDLAKEKNTYDNFVANCFDKLPEIIPDGIELHIRIWKQKIKGENLHNRYLLTNMLGIMLGTGSDESDNPNYTESDDFVLLDEGQHVIRYRQYSSPKPAFDIVGEPFILRSQKY